jgi:Promethin
MDDVRVDAQVVGPAQRLCSDAWATYPVITTFAITLGLFWLVPVLLFIGFALSTIVVLLVGAAVVVTFLATMIIGSACKRIGVF